MTAPFQLYRLAAPLAAALAMVAAGPGHARDPSAKPVRIIAAGPAGGTADFVSRLLAEGLQRELNRPAIVDPKPGASGSLAVSDLMQSPRDGNTVLVAISSVVSEVPHVLKL